VTTAEKEGLALDLAVAALSKVQRLAHTQLLEGTDPAAVVAEMEDAATKALASVGHLETPDAEDEQPSLGHLPKREAEKVAVRLKHRGRG
jgi:hypothetical protein